MKDKWSDEEDMDEGEDGGKFQYNNDESSDFIDIKEVIERSKDYHLSEYFMDTRHNAKRRSAMSWLEICDLDTIDLIKSYGKKVVAKDFEETSESIATENTTKDIFDSEFDNNTESNRIISDEEDFYSLTLLILAWENDALYVSSGSVPEAAFTLAKYSAIEVLMRDGLVEAKGNGTLTSVKTDYVLTKKCEKMTKKELTAALKSISKANKANKANKTK